MKIIAVQEPLPACQIPPRTHYAGIGYCRHDHQTNIQCARCGDWLCPHDWRSVQGEWLCKPCAKAVQA